MLAEYFYISIIAAVFSYLTKSFDASAARGRKVTPTSAIRRHKAFPSELYVREKLHF